MKVLISRPKPWFGPYQLAELLCWWAKSERDEYGFRTKPHWVHQFGEWLAYGSIEPEREVGARYKLGNSDRTRTWLYKALVSLSRVYPRVQYVKLDWWDSDKTLSPVILELLYRLKRTKQGAPFVEDDDVPEYLKATPKKDEWDVDEHWFDRWDYVLDEMIYAFERSQQDWEQEFFHGTSDLYFEKQEGGYSQLIRGEHDTSWVDEEGLTKERERIQTGFRLFGKYYSSLWS